MIGRRQRSHSFALLLMFLVMPNTIYFLLPFTSQAPGLALTLPCMVAILAVQRRKIPHTILIGAGALSLFLVLHFIAAALLQPVGAIRFLGSLILLFAMLIVAASCAQPLFRAIESRAVTHLFWALIVCAILGILGLQFVPSTNATGKPVFPFSEPSIFALSMSPVFMFVYAMSQGWRRFLFGSVMLAVALLLQSFTLLVTIAIVFGMCLPLRWVLALVAVGTVVVLLGGDDQFSYYANRVDFSSENQNLTAVVYTQGWQMIFESWSNSYGWGAGFQQLGVNGTAVDAADIILAVTGGTLNQLDGSFVLVKLISDFGAFGVIAIGLYLRAALSSLKVLRRMALGQLRVPMGRMLAHAVILTFFTEIFMRGAGYLTGTAALFVAALSYLYGWGQAKARTGQATQRQQVVSA